LHQRLIRLQRCFRRFVFRALRRQLFGHLIKGGANRGKLILAG
jgi:hypothetical protein